MSEPSHPWRRILKPEGTYVACSGEGGEWLGPIPRLLRISRRSRKGPQRWMFYVVDLNSEDLAFLADRLEAEDIVPFISKHWTLAEVPEALRISGTGHARGKMVIDVAE